MKIYNSLFFLFIITLSGCFSNGYVIKSKLPFSENFKFCSNEIDSLGICYLLNPATEFDSAEWVMLFKNPTVFKFDKNWIIAKNNKKYFITKNTNDPKLFINFTSRNYKKYVAKFKKLNIPDSLFISK